MLHRVKDLSPEQRLTVEGLLGRAISEEEAVSVKAIQPGSMLPTNLPESERKAVLAGLNEYFERVDARRTPGVSEEEEEAIINEAILSVRPSYRPIE